MDRRTDGFSISDSPTHLEALRWFALGSSASALNYTIRVSISTAPRLNQSGPEAAALDGWIFPSCAGGVIPGAEQVFRTLNRAIQLHDACDSGRWVVVVLDQSHIAVSTATALLPTLVGKPADVLEKARGRQVVA